ncbi:MAG: hypothetical protein FWE71_01880 [Nocardioidaceae bacterium]|nr:hypothetical protein [Nocardioidaceae bacterium]MCL2613848.1 hypothetical protein [Nocardioidaceae bacterium]
MSHYDNQLPFSPLTDTALLDYTLRKWAVSGATGFPDGDHRYLHAEQALRQRLTGSKLTPNTSGVHNMNIGHAS